MARTISEIYQEMLDEKSKYSSLNNLNSTSQTAIWRSIFYVIAVVIASLEQLQDVFKTEITTLAKSLPVGTTKWYAQKALEYQEGYSLTYNRSTGAIEYSVIDTSAQIVKVASSVNENDTVVIKVAKYTDDELSLTALTQSQLTALSSYINDIKFAGTLTKVISLPGDLMRLNISVLIDKTKINNLGQSVTDTNKYPVEDVINQYLLDFSITDFNAEFALINLIDVIQKTDGVKNVNITSAKAKPYNATSFLDIFDTEFNTYQSNAGYIVIDPDYTLRNNIIYV